MPPKKIDPETKEKQYKEYLESEEYLKICQIYDDINVNLINLHKANDPFISEVSEVFDLSGKHQNLWDRLYELAVLMKIKPPFKKLEHEWMRSTYFGQKIKVNKEDKPYVIDHQVCEFEPEYADAQRNIKQILHKNITFHIKQKEDSFDIDNYTKTRGEIKKGFNELFKSLKTYTKKPFKIIYEEKFMSMIKPYSDLLQINMKLVLYEIKYQSEVDKYVNQFKKKAIVQRYCECLQTVLHTLMVCHNKPVTHKIKPSNVFKKLEYSNLSKLQKFYLDPFNKAFSTMKEHLCAQFTTGINFWHIPLEKNTVFVEDLIELINWELIVERHLGNDLLRDQFNFVADVLNSIDKANHLAKQLMLNKDDNAIKLSVPKLIAFKTIQHMRSYKDKEKQIQIKEEERRRIMGKTVQSKNEEEQPEKSLAGSPSQTKNAFSKVGESQVKPEIKGLKLLRKDSLDEARENLGRYWIWENYCDDQFKNTVIEDAVEKLRHINKAVQQDIQDSIIVEGMIPCKGRHDQDRKTANQTLKNMKTLHQKQTAENMKRPPQLWNFEQIYEEQHRFRSIADPKKCYIDGRIGQLDDLIKQVGEHLRTHSKRDWTELIYRVIDFYDGKPDSNPAHKD